MYWLTALPPNHNTAGEFKFVHLSTAPSSTEQTTGNDTDIFLIVISTKKKVKLRVLIFTNYIDFFKFYVIIFMKKLKYAKQIQKKIFIIRSYPTQKLELFITLIVFDTWILQSIHTPIIVQ